MIKFGPSGNGASFSAMGFRHTEDDPEYLERFGLDCFEYSFGRGITMSEGKAKIIGEAFRQRGKQFSVHAPYFINFANPDDAMAEKSYAYVINSAKYARLFGSERVCFHPAAQGKAERRDAVALTSERLKILRDRIYEEGLEDIMICPETMGKLAQIGTIEEVVEFCKIDKIFVPCVDFGHVNAREGGSLKTTEDFRARLDYMVSELGYEKMKNFHVHFSKIEYGEKGEIRHLTFEDKKYGPECEPFLEALKGAKLEPYIVTESAGTQAEDAKYMKDCYFGVRN
ncbi:MAG: TIM barrel protein [Clostridia bacterium]|nr:TIM barrel protein [Clostridia bacterium]